MSASNWKSCPRCAARAKAAARVSLDAVMEQYGKIPAAEFAEKHRIAQAAADALSTPLLRQKTADLTFREDYEIYGAETGTVTVSYGASCAKCGLSLSFEDKHEIPGATQ